MGEQQVDSFPRLKAALTIPTTLSARLSISPVNSSMLTADCSPDIPNSRGKDRIRLFHAGMTDAPMSTPV